MSEPAIVATDPQRRALVAALRDRHDGELRSVVARRATPDAWIVASACRDAWAQLVDADDVDLHPPRWSALAWVTSYAMRRACAGACSRSRRPGATLSFVLTLKRQPAAGTAQLVAALERAWRTIADAHPDLPPAALILGQGSGRRGGGLVLGHFAAERWQLAGAKEGAYVHEVLIGGEGLQRGPRDVLATLLHEGAHAIAAVRGIEDTSRQGRYHNARYKRIAEEVGLDVDRDATIGWSLTALPDTTAQTYAPTIEELTRAITLHRRTESSGPGAAVNPNLIAAVCNCPRRIRVAPGTLQKGAIVCDLCKIGFQAAPAATMDDT